jgi:hypothetical protein
MSRFLSHDDSPGDHQTMSDADHRFCRETAVERPFRQTVSEAVHTPPTDQDPPNGSTLLAANSCV